MFGLTPFENDNYDLFNAFNNFENEVFGTTPFASFKTDIKDEGDKYVMEAELPGFKKEEINLSLNDDILTLSAQHSEEKNDKDESSKYIRKERSYGSYKRSFDVSGIDTSKIEAAYNDGILTLTMPKAAPVKEDVKQIPIK